MKKLEASKYEATDEFRAIDWHACVMDETGGLIAATGPAGDAESERMARLFAAAPDLLDALQAILKGFVDGEIKWAKPRRSDSDPYHPANVKLMAALAKAEGEGGAA